MRVYVDYETFIENGENTFETLVYMQYNVFPFQQYFFPNQLYDFYTWNYFYADDFYSFSMIAYLLTPKLFVQQPNYQLKSMIGVTYGGFVSFTNNVMDANWMFEPTFNSSKGVILYVDQYCGQVNYKNLTIKNYNGTFGRFEMRDTNI